MRLSYSALKLYQACPYLYKYRYVEGNPLPTSKEAKFGSLVHEIMEFIHQDPVKPASEAQALEQLKARWQQEMSDNIFEDPNEQKSYFLNAQNILKNYFAREDLGKTQIIALEKYFKVPFFDPKTNETHFITGRIDRIDKHPEGGFEVIDYKTSARLPKQSILENDLQLPLYHLGLTELWPKLFKKQSRPIKLTLYYLRPGERLTFEQTPKDLQTVKQRVLAIIHEIQQALKTDNFPARHSGLCEFYPYCTICPYTRHRYQTQQSPTLDQRQIQKLIDEFLTLKSQEKKIQDQLEQIKRQLHAYLDQKGLESLYSPTLGQSIERSTNPRYEYDWQKVKQILEPLGVWEKALTISNTALNSLLNDLPPAQQEQIKKARYQTGSIQTLRIRKAK